MTKIIYLSHFLDEDTPGYAGVKSFDQIHVSEITNGATSNSQKWTMSNHVGTHVDLPSHFDNRGRRLEDFDPSEWIMERPFLINLKICENQIIEYSTEFDRVPENCDILIIKTKFQEYRRETKYWENGPGLSPILAEWIRKNRPSVKILGFDFISITSFSNRPLGRIAHRKFLGIEGENSPLRVIEDMKLDQLDYSPKKIIIAPILVKTADGAPVTVFAEV